MKTTNENNEIARAIEAAGTAGQDSNSVAQNKF
jgi:hypothetical protein